MSDDLRSALESAFEEADKPEVVESAPVVEAQTEVEMPVETAAEAEARQRDEKGRFAAKQEAQASTPHVDPVAAPVAPENVAPSPQDKRVPNTWRKEAAAQWAQLPDSIKDEVLKRENDARTGIQQYRQQAEIAREFEEASKPFEQTMRQLGVRPVQAFQALLAADHKLRYSQGQEKARYFAELAREYGVDLQQVAPLPPLPPEYQQMQQELRQLRQQQEQFNRQQTQHLGAEIEEFAATHEHFEKLRGPMGVLLENGHAKGLPDAYEKAMWADPDIRASLISKQTEEATKKAQESALAQRQKAASVSVKGSSPASGSSSGPKSSLREELQAQFDSIG